MDAPDFGSLPTLTIDLAVADTPDRYCTEYVDTLHKGYSAHMDSQHPGYSRLGTGTSVALLPATYDEWFDEVGYYTRRKVRKAGKLGYEFAPIERDRYLADIYEINTSLDERQGRPMGEKYRQEVEPFGPLPDQPCPRHRFCTYGVLKDGQLVAYAWVYQTGEMFLLSTLLGHGKHLGNGVMFLLIAGVIKDLIESAGSRYAVYERHWSGTDGLRFFKEQMGFRPYLVTFLRGDERPPPLRARLLAALAPRVAVLRERTTRTRSSLSARVGPFGELARRGRKRVIGGLRGLKRRAVAGVTSVRSGAP
jgi:hypothetical protein